MYKINEVTGTEVTNSTRYLGEMNTVNNTSTGLYASVDDYGTSYYYRGDKEQLNNNLIWGGLQWKIIRINGDGSIRIIYNGTEEQFRTNNLVNNNGEDTQLPRIQWHPSNIKDAKFVGYMFGGTDDTPSIARHGSTSEAANFNETSANIKIMTDDWYNTNIIDKVYSNIVVDNLFCSDRQIRSEIEGVATGLGFGNNFPHTYYSNYYRLYEIKNPSFKCALQNDRFTVSDTTLGNGALTYPFGLFTASEASLAGLKYGVANSKNYLYTKNKYWTLSPNYMEYNVGGVLLHVGEHGDCKEHMFLI